MIGDGSRPARPVGSPLPLPEPDPGPYGSSPGNPETARIVTISVEPAIETMPPMVVRRAGIGERVIALLDQMDGDPDLEPDTDAEPFLAAPENPHGSQVGWCRGNDEAREAEVPEIRLPEVAIVSPVPKLRPVPSLPWGGEGNVVAAAGAALLALVAGA